VFRELDLPFTSDEQIRKVIKFEAESHLQTNIEEMLVCFKKLGKLRDKSHLLLMTRARTRCSRRSTSSARPNIDPIVVDLELTALFNTVVALGYTEEHACFVVVDCEPSSTSILFIERRRAGRRALDPHGLRHERSRRGRPGDARGLRRPAAATSAATSGDRRRELHIPSTARRRRPSRSRWRRCRHGTFELSTASSQAAHARSAARW
jgi:hypothetical protein